jgi:hypothetical protein
MSTTNKQTQIFKVLTRTPMKMKVKMFPQKKKMLGVVEASSLTQAQRVQDQDNLKQQFRKNHIL